MCPGSRGRGEDGPGLVATVNFSGVTLAPIEPGLGDLGILHALEQQRDVMDLAMCQRLGVTGLTSWVSPERGIWHQLLEMDSHSMSSFVSESQLRMGCISPMRGLDLHQVEASGVHQPATTPPTSMCAGHIHVPPGT